VTVTTVYNPDLSRVTITATSLGDAQTALVERSTDQVVWSTVRGGTAVPVSAGTMATLDDFEFSSDVLNYYRVTYADEVTYRSTGTAAHAANASVVPGLPAGHAQGDLLLLWACTRNAAQGVPATPAGYSVFGITDQGRLFGKIRGASESAPTVTFTGGGDATMSVSAQMAAFTKVQAVTGEAQGVANASAQNITTPTAIPQADNSLIIWAGWKQDDWTGSTKPAAATAEVGDTSTTLGDDQGVTWAYLVQDAKAVVAASSFAITGGVSAISRAMVIEFLAATTSQTGSITPSLAGEVWLKFIGRPFLNQTVDAYGEINVTRRARNAVFPVVGRSAPIGVTDVRSGREFNLLIKTLTAETHRNLDFAVLGGDPVFVHAPADSPVPSMYAVIGDTQDDQPVPGTHFWTLPLIEVAAPVPEVVGTTITWQGVLNAYATWADVLAGEPTWADLLLNIGSPSDVIVG
jgi:hypothetical protein